MHLGEQRDVGVVAHVHGQPERGAPRRRERLVAPAKVRRVHHRAAVKIDQTRHRDSGTYQAAAYRPDAPSATSEAASWAAAATASAGLGTVVNARDASARTTPAEANDGHAHGVDVGVDGERANGARRPNHGAGPANGAALTKFARLVGLDEARLLEDRDHGADRRAIESGRASEFGARELAAVVHGAQNGGEIVAPG